MLASELPILIDILDEIEVEQDTDYELDENSLLESILYLMAEYVDENAHAVSEPDFYEEFIENVNEMVETQFENMDYLLDDDYVDAILDTAIQLFNIYFMPERSNNNDYNTLNNNSAHDSRHIDIIKQKIAHISSKPQPEQRTSAWYTFRHNLITASSAHQAFKSQATKNQLIYEKCTPLFTQEKSTFVNTSSPLHWGQKYEPVSIHYYEHTFNTKVKDFGCIKHDNYYFLGASPDGINVDEQSPKFGRMLEIKNIVNREINGIPKQEYWIQMQLQMETCDLDECDFLETKFMEYATRQEFIDDGDFLQSVKGETKGIIMYFATEEGRPLYKYKPIDMNESDFIEWETKIMEDMEKYTTNTWISNLYWRLEKVSCVLVHRNHKWFQDNIGELGSVWKTIEQERISGYEHRAPNRKVKIEVDTTTAGYSSSSGCLININKDTGATSVNVIKPVKTIASFFIKT